MAVHPVVGRDHSTMTIEEESDTGRRSQCRDEYRLASPTFDHDRSSTEYRDHYDARHPTQDENDDGEHVADRKAPRGNITGTGEWRSGSVPALGAGGRGFKSPLPDQVSALLTDSPG